MIIPFFLPHSGCPHQCVFCNQKNITGKQAPPDPARIPQTISDYLRMAKSPAPAEVAFFGGTFTALAPGVQQAYLEQVRPFIDSGKISHIRISTRPDCIDRSLLAMLREYHVAIVELGAQSMDDGVLLRSGRGHAAGDTINATALLREMRFRTGLQLMPGLPGDTAGTMSRTIDSARGLNPEFVRIYPALVIKGTPLETLYRNGSYEPLTLGQAVSVCREAHQKFEEAGIAVIRMGLQPTAELAKPGTIIAGPYHPAFRQLVESAILLDAMRAQLASGTVPAGSALFRIHPHDESAAAGQRRGNIRQMKEEFGLAEIRFKKDPAMKKLHILLCEE